jgi:hypothetical protein
MTMKIIYWFSRILAILSILFMMMFSYDMFEGDQPLLRELLGFLKHNIPAFALIIVLIIGWRYEIAGGLLFLLLFFALGIFWGSFSGNSGSLIIIAPFLIVALLFILHATILKNRKVLKD